MNRGENNKVLGVVLKIDYVRAGINSFEVLICEKLHFFYDIVS